MIERSFKETAQFLDTTEGTIRRWCQLLEKEGYLINKTDTNRRKLSEQDVEVMSEIKRLVEHIGLTDACSFVAHKYSQSADHDDKSAVNETEVNSELTHIFRKLNATISEIDKEIYWEGPSAARILKDQWNVFADSFKHYFQIEN